VIGPQIDALGAYLDRLDQENALPKIVVYNLNPRGHYAGPQPCSVNFQDGKIAGKMQLGSGWWYLDQKEAMEWRDQCAIEHWCAFHVLSAC